MLESVRDVAVYRRHCVESSQVPVWHRDWWLDAVAGPERWGATTVLKGDRVVAAMPYRMRRQRGIRVLDQPVLTQFLGPWMVPGDQKEEKRLASEKAYLDQLFDGLPAHELYAQNWAPIRTNWLPLYWRGYQQTTRYTYHVDLLVGGEAIWSDMSTRARGAIRKASGAEEIEVQESKDLSDFLPLHQSTYDRQGVSPAYSIDTLWRIERELSSRGQRFILVARDPQGRPHAGGYFVTDDTSCYYLLGGADTELRASGALNLVIWRAMQHAMEQGLTLFDFEGSMLQPVEMFNRSFGAKQTPYFRVTGAQGHRGKAVNRLLGLKRN